MNDRRPFIAGDRVRHRPSGETWSLACDEEDRRVYPSGYPETRAEASDCDLATAATHAQRVAMLREVADSRGDGYRSAIARRQLAELDEDYARRLVGLELDGMAAQAHAAATRVAILRARYGRDLVRARTHGELLDALDIALCKRSRILEAT